MKGKNILNLIISLFLFIFLISCGPKAQAPLQQPETGLGTEIGQALPDKASEWDRLVSLARKEKKVSIYSVANGELRPALIKAMRDKFNIDVDMVTGRAAELTPKLFNERKAGIFAVDVYIGGSGSLVNDLKPAGIFEPLEPQLLLPEVLDGNLWWEGKLPFLDRDKQIIAFCASASPALAINTNLVGKDELRSYRDLLHPKWKGKMILNDPGTPGIAQNWFGVAGPVMGLEYMRALAAMDLMVTRDQRLQVEWVAQGKYLIAIAAQQSTVSQFISAGAPLYLFSPQEVASLVSSSGNLALLRNAPHPNAARVFINYLLSKEGQTVFSKAVGFQSARKDVPTEHLDPASTRQEGVKYISSINEDFRVVLWEYAEYAREIFGPLSK